MNSKHLFSLFVLCIFSLCLVACNSQPTVDTPSITNSPAIEAALPTSVNVTSSPIIPTAVPQPTDTPPVACMIAFESDRDGNSEIYMMGPDGKDPVNLTNNPSEDNQPAISADGSQIAFISNRETETCVGQSLYIMNADGGDLRQLSNCIWANSPNWSTDGEWITFSADGDIFIVRSDGAEDPINLTNSPDEEGYPVISPDNQKIAFLSGGSQNWNVFTMNLDGSDRQQLTTKGGEIGIDWSEDGRIVVVGWNRGDQGCCNFVMNADGSEIVEAGGKGEMQKYLPFWTLDGNRVECVGLDLSGNSEIYLVGEVFPDIFLNLTNNPANDTNPSWPAKCGPSIQSHNLEVEQSQENTEIIIGYAGDNPWEQQRKDNFLKACDELKIKCIVGETEALIEQRVNAIIQNSNNIIVNGLHPLILEARDKGIPVFVLDAESSTDGAYNITIDHQKWAAKSLEWMFEEMGKAGEFAFFNFQSYNGHKLIIGDMLDKYPGIKVVEQRHDDYTHDYKIMEADVRSFMEKYPNIKAIWANGEMNNVIWGVKGTVPPDDWPLVMCEATKSGLEAWNIVKAENPGFNCVAMSNPPGIAYDATYAAYYLVSGFQINPDALSGEFGKTLYVDFPIVTQENIDEWWETIKKENEKYLIDELMSPDDIKDRWFLEK